nr:hypothetical protein [Klebsiella pneumoniae]
MLDVTTGKRLYTNMVIRSLDVTTERTSENVLMATVTLREIITVRDYARGRVKVLYCGAYADGYDGYNFDYERIGREMGRTGGAYSDFWKAEEKH